MLEVQKISNERSKLRKAELLLDSIKQVNCLISQYLFFFCLCRLNLIINNLSSNWKRNKNLLTIYRIKF